MRSAGWPRWAPSEPSSAEPMADPANIPWLVGWGVTEPSGRDRRESERIVAYWEEKLQALGGDFTVAELDLDKLEVKRNQNARLAA